MPTNYARPTSKEVYAFLKEASKRGWGVTGGGQRHYRLTCPNSCKCALTLSRGSGYPRALANSKADLKRYTCWNGDKP